MKYGTSTNPDNSSFTGVAFENMEIHAVTSWANDGVTFTDCEFNNCGRSGILTHQSQIIVNSPSGGLASGKLNFFDMPTGIELLDPSMKAGSHDGSEISNQKFQCEQAALDIIGVDSRTPNIFENNKVRGVSSNRIDGVRVIGASNVNLTNNTFESLTGVGLLLLQAGASGNDNPVTDNLFTDCEKGSAALGDNSMTEYSRNCFMSSRDYDISVLPVGGAMCWDTNNNLLQDPWEDTNGDGLWNVDDCPFAHRGAIRYSQGSTIREAGNCFTGGVPEVRNLSTTGVPIDYFIFDAAGNTIPVPTIMCHGTPNSSGVRTVLATIPDASTCTGSSVTWIVGPPREDCKMQFSSVGEVLDLILAADQKVQELEISGISEHDILVAKSLTKNLLDDLGRLIIENLGGSQFDKNFLINYYSERPEFNIRSLVPSIYIEEENYVQARSSLNQIVSSSHEESEYIEVQHTYLDYLEGRFEAVSESSVDRLRVIAEKQHSMSGYAFALYYLITGEKPEIHFPYQELTQRERSTNKYKREIAVFPNPTSDIVTVNVSENEISDYNFTLTGMNGVRFLEKVVSSNSEVTYDVSTIPAGLYSVSIQDAEGITIFKDRMVIIH